MAKEKHIVGNYKWPESIDFDQAGNFSFTNALEKAFFQIKRNKDNTLASIGSKLLSSNSHTFGN